MKETPQAKKVMHNGEVIRSYLLLYYASDICHMPLQFLNTFQSVVPNLVYSRTIFRLRRVLTRTLRKLQKVQINNERPERLTFTFEKDATRSLKTSILEKK